MFEFEALEKYPQGPKAKVTWKVVEEFVMGEPIDSGHCGYRSMVYEKEDEIRRKNRKECKRRRKDEGGELEGRGLDGELVAKDHGLNVRVN